ncbi:hypothetical protein Tco_1325440, partial [Tanacetum coccineum]
TDISKITRNSPKMSKHGHEKRKSTKEAKDSKPKPREVNPWSILSQQKDKKTPKLPNKPSSLQKLHK